jgi:hypothetical protein
VSNDTDKFHQVIGELDRLLTPGTGDGFWSARPIFAEMDRAFLSGWAACRVKDILDETDLHVFRDRNALTINVTKGYAVSLAMIDRPPDGLFLYPQHYLARNVGRVPLTVRRYRPDRPVQNDVYDPAVRLELHNEFQLEPGQSLERDGYADVLDWGPTEETGYVLRLHSESLGTYEWAFDRQTGAPRGVTVLDSYSSQITTVMQMLTAMDTPVDEDFIEMGLTSRYFHVRWETLKMIGQLAPERVQATVERLSSDPHPVIRQAAERTLLLNAANKNAGD